MNKKQITVTFILAVLMVSLVVVQRFFNNKFENIAITNQNMGKLEEYYLKNGKYSYKLPESWSVEELVSSSTDLCRIDFKDSTNNIIGSIQMIENDENDIKTIAEIDINNMILERNEEEVENFKSGNKKGIKVKYKTKVNNGYNYINSSYYIPMEKGERIKVTFIVKEDNYNDDMVSVFDIIVRSINK